MTVRKSEHTINANKNQCLNEDDKLSAYNKQIESFAQMNNIALTFDMMQVLVEVIPAGALITDVKGIVVSANSSAHEIMGENLIGSNMLDKREGYSLHHPDGSDFPLDELPLPISLRKQKSIRDVEVMVKRGSTTFRILTSSSPIFDKDENLIGAFGIFLDVTSRKVVEDKIKEDDKIIRGFFNSVTAAIWLVDKEYTVHAVNKLVEERFGVPESNIIGTNVYDYFPTDVSSSRRMITDEVFRTGKQVSFVDFRQGFYLENNIYPIKDDDGNVIKLAISSQDVTQRVITEASLRESEERFRLAFEYAAIGIAMVTLDGKFIKTNHSMSSILGYTEQEFLLLNEKDICIKEDNLAYLDNLSRLIDGGIQYYHMEKRYYHKSGATITVLISVSLIKNTEGKNLYLIMQIQDITLRKQAENILRQSKLEAEKAKEHAEYLARIDYLTNILNRRAFIERYEKEFHYAKAESTDISIIIADIDNFKAINDSYGHQSGDTVLKEFAKVIKSICRQSDFLGRYGGEEFIICLPKTNCHEALRIAERMRKKIESFNIDIENSKTPVNITTSFGVSSLKLNNTNNPDYLIGLADSALYQAKLEGKNKVCVYSGNDRHKSSI